MKMKREVCILLSHHSKMKLLGCSWNFHVWNPKRLLFMLAFIRSTGVDTWFVYVVWIYLDLVYQLECLLYDIRKLCALVFHFSDFVLILMPIWILSNPRFDQDNWNKFKTWKWKGKPVSFLISHSNMKFLGGFWNFHVWNPKPLIFMLDFIRQSLGIRG